MKRIMFVECNAGGETWTTPKFLTQLVLNRPFWRVSGQKQLEAAMRILTEISKPDATFVDVTEQEKEWLEQQAQLPEVNLNPSLMLMIFTQINAIASAKEPKETPA